MKTVRELAQEIGVSRQSVYRKIKEIGLLQELQQSDSKVTTKLQLNKQQEKTIKRAFNINIDSNNVTQELQQSDSKVTRLIDTLQANNEEKQKTIESLQEIIKNLQETTKEQTKLLDQQQQLTLKTQQQLELLQLEYKSKDTPLQAETKQEENTTVKHSKWKFWKRGN